MPTCTRYDINLVCWADIPFFGELFRGFPFYFCFWLHRGVGWGIPAAWSCTMCVHELLHADLHTVSFFFCLLGCHSP